MNILHLNNQARFQGGVEQILFDTAASLRERGIRQGLLYRDEKADPKYLTPFSWSGTETGSAEIDFAPDIIVIHKYDDTRVLTELTRRYHSLYYVHDHDLVCPRRHKYLPVSGEICDRAAGLNCLRNLCVIERSAQGSIVPVTAFQGLMRQRALIASTRSCTAFAVGSRWMRDSLVANGIPREDISIVPPVPRIAQPLIQPRPDRNHLLFVGQLVRGKGVDLLIRAFAKVETDCDLTIVGEGNHRAHCERLAHELGLGDRITFTGFVPNQEVSEYYATATIVAVPSRWPEPFGMVGIEAMSRGKPVVAFASGGITDWLAHNETGLLARTGDTEQFAQHIDTLLAEHSTYERMSKAAAKRVRDHYTHEKYIDRFLDALPRPQNRGVNAL